MIADLESKLEELNTAPPEEPEPVVEDVVHDEPVYHASGGDEVDELLAKYINLANCPVPIKRLGNGYYLFGTRKIFAKIMNQKLVIRVGGGWMMIEEFIQTYAEVELNKIEAMKAKGMDPFAKWKESSPGG